MPGQAMVVEQAEGVRRKRCPVCSQTAVRHTWKRKFDRDEKYYLYHCHACEVQFWEPMRNPGSEWYEERKYSPYRAVSGRLGVKFELFLKSGPLTEGRILDIGCSSGSFLKACQDMGFDVTGIDFNRQAVQDARRLHGLKNVYALSLEQYRREHPADRFEAVSFFEVLEHQDDPAAFIGSVAGMLVRGGYVVLSVPNRDRWQLLKKLDDDPPEHLTRWNPMSVRIFLQANGFQVMDLREIPFTVETGRLFITDRLMKIIRGKSAGTGRSTTGLTAGTGGLSRYRLLYASWRLAITPPSLALAAYARAAGKKESTIYCLARLED